MNRTASSWFVICVACTVPWGMASAQGTDSAAPAPGAPSARGAPAPGVQRPLTIAILDFAAKEAGNADLGKEIGEALTAILSGEAGLVLVDRTSLARTLQEQSLNLTGLVSNEQAIKVGQLVGARIIVTGRAFALGKQLFITAKLIGTETSLVEGTIVKGDAEADLGQLTIELSRKVADALREKGPRIVAQPDAATDPLPGLRAQLSHRKLPTVAVIVREQHHAAPTLVNRRAIDPAVESEVKKVLIESGFTLVDVPENELTDFSRTWKPDDVNSWPRGLAKADVLISGEAFSEFGARIGSLVSGTARAEINVIARKDGKIVFADRVTTRGADLTEHVAAKTALQKAGRTLAIDILQHWIKSLPQN